MKHVLNILLAFFTASLLLSAFCPPNCRGDVKPYTMVIRYDTIDTLADHIRKVWEQQHMHDEKK